MKNPFKKPSEVGKVQASPKPTKEKPKSKPKKKKDVGKTSSADSAQAGKILKKKIKKNNDKKSKPLTTTKTTKPDVRKEKPVKKVKAPQARLVAATNAAPTDDDPNSPGSGGELSLEQIAVLKQVLGIKTQKQLEKFRSNFTPENIAQIKKNLNDPSKRKTLQKENADVANDDLKGFAKFSGGPQAFVGLDPTKWVLQKFRFDGKSKCEVTGDLEEINAPIKEGVIQFITSPITYLAMMFQSNMLKFASEKQKYTLLLRKGTYQYRPLNTMDADDPNAKGIFTLLMWTYRKLPCFPNNELPMQARDKYTDDMTYQGHKLHSGPDNIPVLPGRGMGIGDAPNLCVIKDVDPTDVYQGTVGDCWLLGAISSLAEFDGAIKRLFKKTKLLDKRPLPGPNMYTIVLCDLETWKPKIYHIDERLPVKSDSSGKLLSCRLSGYGELWPALLEKAMAIHCGGWDAIHGGQCTHAWSIMTGCKEQYDIERNPKTGKFFALSKFNPNTKKWEKHYNNPKDDPGNNLWKSDWPKEGGGGSGEITEDDLFRRLCKWDDVNFIMSVATTGAGGVSSVGLDPGLIDDHAYSLIECYENVAGTGVSLAKLRNPWGSGEIETGEFDGDGPGWDKYPQIVEALNPVFEDDGMFWVTKEEIFRFFQTFYLSASNMTEFVEDE